jgi:hypothetical protein
LAEQDGLATLDRTVLLIWRWLMVRFACPEVVVLPSAE